MVKNHERDGKQQKFEIKVAEQGKLRNGDKIARNWAI